MSSEKKEIKIIDLTEGRVMLDEKDYPKVTVADKSIAISIASRLGIFRFRKNVKIEEYMLEIGKLMKTLGFDSNVTLEKSEIPKTIEKSELFTVEIKEGNQSFTAWLQKRKDSDYNDNFHIERNGSEEKYIWWNIDEDSRCESITTVNSENNMKRVRKNPYNYLYCYDGSLVGGESFRCKGNKLLLLVDIRYHKDKDLSAEETDLLVKQFNKVNDWLLTQTLPIDIVECYKEMLKALDMNPTLFSQIRLEQKDSWNEEMFDCIVSKKGQLDRLLRTKDGVTISTNYEDSWEYEDVNLSVKKTMWKEKVTYSLDYSSITGEHDLFNTTPANVIKGIEPKVEEAITLRKSLNYKRSELQ